MMNLPRQQLFCLLAAFALLPPLFTVFMQWYLSSIGVDAAEKNRFLLGYYPNLVNTVAALIFINLGFCGVALISASAAQNTRGRWRATRNTTIILSFLLILYFGFSLFGITA